MRHILQSPRSLFPNSARTSEFIRCVSALKIPVPHFGGDSFERLHGGQTVRSLLSPPSSPKKPGCQSPQARRPHLRPLSAVRKGELTVSALSGCLRRRIWRVGLRRRKSRSLQPFENHRCLGVQRQSRWNAVDCADEGALAWIEPKISELHSPVRVGITQALDVDTARKTTFNGRVHE